MIFSELQGDDLGVYKDENYRLVECLDGHIVFSYTRKGNAISAHFAADKQGLRYIKEAIDKFCLWLFSVYDWCRVIFAVVDQNKSSVMQMVKKCNFEYLTEDDEFQVYMRANA